VEDWKDINPRVGIAYDLFGNGKTALKGSIARYVNGEQIGTANANNPETTIGISDTRAWNDLDQNGSPFAANGNLELNELTKTANSLNFGQNVPTTTTTDPATLNGWGKRPYNWEYTASVQHQLFPRIGVNGGWYRRSFGNQTFTEDPRLSAASYDTFCITAPVDSSLPNGGGYPVCGLADLKPSVAAALGPPANLITFDSNFGGITNIFEGFDLSANARLPGGTFFQVGVNAQKEILNTCNLNLLGVYTPTTLSTGTEIFPGGARACDQVFPYRPDVKIAGSHVFPWGIQLSGTYQFSQGANILGNWSISNAIANGTNGLGRSFSEGVTSKLVSIVEPGADYGSNLQQLDMRASKRISIDRVHIRLDADLYNIFNTNWPYTLNNTFTMAASSQYLRPTNVLQGRLFKIGGQLDF
jgi:hypothetical protein